MTKAKKAIGVILAVVMLATMFAFGSLAVTPGNATFTVTPSATQVEIGDTVTVTVAVTTDYYAGPIGVPVHYDAALFDYVEGSFTPNADIYGAGAADANSFNNNGCLTVAFAPKSEVAGVKAQVLNNVTLFTFQLTAKANGVSPVQLKAEDQKALGNMTGKLYCGQKANAAITSEDIMIGQTFTLNNSSVTIGSAAAPELILTEHGTEVGAVINRDLCTGDGYTGCVMGVDTLGIYDMDTLDACFTTEAGHIVVNTDNSNGMETTGAVIELYDDSDNLLETYVFIYFGDLDFDGSITGSDATICNDYELTYEGLDEEFMLLAADIDADTMVTGSDGAILTDYELTYDPEGSFYSTQAKIAANYA